jgi:hypothetical protein
VDWSPRFSPDGSRLVFRSERDGGGIYVVNALGGGLRRVAGPGIFPRFSPDGTTIVFAEDPQWAPTPLRRIFMVPANGGIVEPFLPGWGVFRPPASIGPVFSPDGRRVLLYGAPIDDPRRRDWWVAPTDGGEPWSSEVGDEVLGLDVMVAPAVWLPGRLLVVAGTTIEGLNLYRIGITDEGLITGTPTPLTAGPGMTWCPSVADNGRIALTRFYWVIHLWEVALDPRTGGAVGPPRRITDDAAPKFSFSLTRAGDRLAYSAYAGPRGDRRAQIVLQDRTTDRSSVLVTLTEEQVSTSAYPRLSADGSMLSWATWSDGQRVSWVAPLVDPMGRELCRGCSVVDFFNNGRDVLVTRGRTLYRRTLADGDENLVLEPDEGVLLDTDLSPDERWLAVHMGEPDGTVTISVVPFDRSNAEPDSWIEISAGPRWSGAPRWSADGSVLYFLSERDDFICVWGQRLDPDSKIPIGEPFAVVHAHTSSLQNLSMARFMWTLEVGGDRLVFNAGEMTGDVYTAMLDED